MFKPIILSVLLLQSIVDGVDAENKSETRQTRSRIIGGELAPVDKYPWFTRLIFNGSMNFSGCAGMLVSPEYVLTSASCAVSVGAYDLVAEIGTVCELFGNCGQPQQVMDIQRAMTHNQFNPSTLDYDVALLKLTSKANAKPVKM